MRCRPFNDSAADKDGRLGSYFLIAVMFAALAGGLQGCASVPDSSWPSLPKVAEPDVMTPEQRQKVLQDMQKASAGQAAPVAKQASQ
jgi:hypothetical protein